MVGSEVSNPVQVLILRRFNLFSVKRNKKKAWDEEWGDLDTEGNI